MDLEILVEDDANNIQQRNNDQRLKIKENTKEFEEYPFLLTKTNILVFQELYDATKKGDVDKFVDTLVLKRVSEEKKLILSSIFERESPSGNSLLHEAARFGKKEMIELIAHHFPFLLTWTNILGDTALHVATKARESNIIDVLIKVITTSSNAADGDANVKYELLRMKNHNGNTAFLEAVINGYLDGVKCLFSADHQMAHHLNKDGKSPLRLAVEYEKKDVLEFLLVAVRDDDLVGMPRVESPVYAAITRKKSDILEVIHNKRPTLFHMRDEKENTALHFAASIGNLGDVRFLLGKFSDSDLQWNKNGDFPIHMASKKGHVKIVKELLQRQWPDPRTLLNNEGQNILHVAAKNGRKGVVQYILKNKQLGRLLNAKDKNGNTPLHLASTNFHPSVLVSLTWDKRVDLKLINNDGMTAKDLGIQRAVDTLDIPTITDPRKVNTLWALNTAGAPWTEKGKNIWRQRNKKPPNMQEQVNSLGLVAILVATVTFAAGFTVPGGFNSSDTVAGQGMAILVNRKIFQVFIICDTIAMFSSIIATFILLWAQLVDVFLARTAYGLALLFTWIGLFTMSVAFMSGVYLVVSKLPWLANVVLIMGIIFLAVLFHINVLLIFPAGVHHPVVHFFCHFTIPLLNFISGISDMVVEDNQHKKLRQ